MESLAGVANRALTVFASELVDSLRNPGKQRRRALGLRAGRMQRCEIISFLELEGRGEVTVTEH
jgi:hypothetical protein